MIWQFIFWICLGVNPFNVPWVPTGINTGVSTGPWGKVSRDTLALVVEQVAIVLNVKALFILSSCRGGRWKFFFATRKKEREGSFKRALQIWSHLTWKWHRIQQQALIIHYSIYSIRRTRDVLVFIVKSMCFECLDMKHRNRRTKGVRILAINRAAFGVLSIDSIHTLETLVYEPLVTWSFYRPNHLNLSILEFKF